jgi:hypothetical protein
MPGIRQPAVAGQFYEGRREALETSLERCFTHPLGPGSLPTVNPNGPGFLDAVISPHAGYMYSGPAAAHGYAALAADGIPEAVIILGPSHYTASRRAALSLVDAWRTPLGDTPINVELGRRLLEASPLFEEDEKAHHDEHSLEVQLPFLQFIYREQMPAILPICIRSYPMGNVEALVSDARAIGEHLAQVAGDLRVVVIASTDFSHQVPHDLAVREDRHALDAILALDSGRLLHVVADRSISMCGPVPVAIAIAFCLARGPHHAEVLRYYTSGDIIGERRAVVGYASGVIRREGGSAA